MTRSHRHPSAFTIIEMFAVLLLISLLVMLLLPAVQAAREMARRSSCANNLMQVAVAVHSYHATFARLPTQLSGTDGSSVAGEDNDRRLSIFVGLLPFLGNAELYENIQHPMVRDPSVERIYGFGMEMTADGLDLEAEDSAAEEKGPWVAGGPEPFDWRYVPWITERQPLRCPSDPGIGRPAMSRSNYAVCLGDGVVGAASGPMKEVNGKYEVDAELAAQTEAAMRGMFVPRVVTRFSDVIDGLSNTIMLGEMATYLGDMDIRMHPIAGSVALRDDPNMIRTTNYIDPERPMFWDLAVPGNTLGTNTGYRRGYRWADGMPLYTGFNTILPPNREIIMSGDCDDCWGILPPSSRHQGGVQIAFADAAVRFVTNSVEAGDPTQPTVYLGSDNRPESPSPYGLWGALGTRSSGEMRANSFGSAKVSD